MVSKPIGLAHRASISLTERVSIVSENAIGVCQSVTTVRVSICLHGGGQDDWVITACPSGVRGG